MVKFCLQVLRADVETKSSDCMAEIIAFAKKLLKMEFSYQSNEYAYFDVAKFDQDPHHSYAKVGLFISNLVCKPVITCFVYVLNQVGLNFE